MELEYDLIVLDGMLPGIDGFVVLAALRQSKSTPVLMLTARSDVEDRVRGLQSGADDYMIKPFAFSELVARISQVLLLRPIEPGVLRANPAQRSGSGGGPGSPQSRSRRRAP